jgi:two-component system, response regulator PdtaR
MLTLVVEDDALSAFALADELELSGHSVVGPARSSGEAIVLVRARPPKLALIDLNLESEGAGLRVAQKISAEFDVSVVFVTGNVQTAREHAADALGVLVKPFDQAEVAAVVRYVEARLRGETPPPPSSPSFELFH